MRSVARTILTASVVFAVAVAAPLVIVPLTVSAAEQVRATLMNASGESVGQVVLHETPHGTLLHATFENLPEGAHGFHVHDIGLCEPPFKSAGGHFNPTATQHGHMNPEGMHAGDMPNIHVPASGRLEIEILNTQLRLDSALFDEDGAALVIHEGPDDYMSDPAGAAGARIACGVIGQ